MTPSSTWAARQGRWLLLTIGVATVIGLLTIIMVILYSHLLQPRYMQLNPCSDFYKYSCAWWFGGMPLYGGLTGRHMRIIRNNTKKLLDGSCKANDVFSKVAFEKAKELYQICVNMFDSPDKDEGLRYVKTTISDFGWPMTMPESNSTLEEVISLMGKIHGMGLSDGMIEISVERSITPPYRNHLTIRQHKLSLSERIHRFDHGRNLEKDENDFRQFIILSIEHLGGNPSEKQVLDDTSEMLKLKKSIQMNKETTIPDDSVENYELMTIKRLMDITRFDGSRDDAKFNWLLLFNIVFEDENNKTNFFSESDEIIVRNKAFITRLGDLLSTTDTRTVRNFLVWNAIEPFMWHTNKMMAGISDKYNPANHNAYYDIWTNSTQTASTNTERTPRWERCIDAAVSCFPHTIHQAYSSYYIGEKTESEISYFKTHIVNTLLPQLYNLKWLDDESRNFFRKKLSAMKNLVGSAQVVVDAIRKEELFSLRGPHVANVVECRKLWPQFQKQALTTNSVHYEPGSNLFGVGVQYDYLRNLLKTLIGVSHAPYFTSKQTPAINFGALGFLLTQALFKAFGDQGQKFDADGKYNRSYWVTNASLQYNRLSQCFEQQYDQYCPSDECQQFGLNALENNIANEGGLRLAYQAYKKWMEVHGEDESILTKWSFITFSQDQLFFLSYSMMQCADLNPLIIKYLMSYEKQSPPNILVNGPLSRMKEFSDAFNCRPGSDMRRSEPCHLWY